jgi:phosphoglycolate phosphatase-like HAD superfamily hydrolase
MSKMVLFDLDGTLLLTQGAGMRAMARAGSALWGEGFHFQGTVAAGSLDPHLFREAAERCGVACSDENHRTFMHAYHRALSEELAGKVINPLPGVLSLLDELHQHPTITLGLLTGNYTMTGPVKLAAAGIDAGLFAVRAFGDDGPDRASLVAVALERYERLHGRRTSSRDVVVVGDTPRDVDCAKAHDCLALAVATGPYTVDQLKQTRADVVLPDLSDATALWEMLGEKR